MPGHALQNLAAEIGAGAYSNNAMDAECHERYEAFPSSRLCRNMQTFCPDIVMLANFQGDLDLMPFSKRQDPDVVLHLVEVGYTSKFRAHDHVQAKLISMQLPSPICAALAGVSCVCMFSS